MTTQTQIRNQNRSPQGTQGTRSQQTQTQAQKDVQELAKEQAIIKRNKAYEKKLLEDAKTPTQRLEARQEAIFDRQNEAAMKGSYQIAGEKRIYSNAQKQILNQRQRLKQNLINSDNSILRIKKLQSSLPNRRSQKSLRGKMGGMQGRIERRKIFQIEPKLKQNIVNLKNYQNKLKTKGNESINLFEKKVKTYGEGISKQQNNLSGYINYLGDKVNYLYQKNANYLQQEKLQSIQKTKFLNQVNKFQNTNPTEKLIINWKDLRVTGVNSGELGRRVSINRYNKELQNMNKSSLSISSSRPKTISPPLSKDLISSNGRLGLNKGLGYSPVNPLSFKKKVGGLNDNNNVSNRIPSRFISRLWSGISNILGNSVDNKKGFNKEQRLTGGVVSAYNSSSFKKYKPLKPSTFQLVTALPTRAISSIRKFAETHAESYNAQKLVGLGNVKSINNKNLLVLQNLPKTNTNEINKLNEIGKLRDTSYKSYQRLNKETIPNFKSRNSINGNFDINKLNSLKLKQYINLQKERNKEATNTKELSKQYETYSNKTAVGFKVLGYKRKVPINRLNSVFGYVNEEAKTVSMAAGQGLSHLGKKGGYYSIPAHNETSLVENQGTIPLNVTTGKPIIIKKYVKVPKENMGTKKQFREIGTTGTGLGMYAVPLLGAGLFASSVGEQVVSSNYSPVKLVKAHPIETGLILGGLFGLGALRTKRYLGEIVSEETPQGIRVLKRGQKILRNRYILNMKYEEVGTKAKELNPLYAGLEKKVPKGIRERINKETQLNYLEIKGRARNIEKGKQTRISLNSGKESYVFRSGRTKEGKEIKSKVEKLLNKKGIKLNTKLIGKPPKIIEQEFSGNLLIAQRGKRKEYYYQGKEKVSNPIEDLGGLRTRGGTSKRTYYSGKTEPYNLFGEVRFTKVGLIRKVKTIPERLSEASKRKVKLSGGRLNSESFFLNKGKEFNKLSQGAERKQFNTFGLSLKKTEKNIKTLSYGREEGVNINGENFVFKSNEINFNPKIEQRKSEIHSTKSIRKERFPFKSYESKGTQESKGTVYLLKNKVSNSQISEEKLSKLGENTNGKQIQMKKSKVKFGRKEAGIISTFMSPIEKPKNEIIQIQKISGGLISKKVSKSKSLIPMVSAVMIEPKTIQSTRIRQIQRPEFRTLSKTKSLAMMKPLEFNKEIVKTPKLRSLQVQALKAQTQTLSKMKSFSMTPKTKTISKTVIENILGHPEPIEKTKIKTEKVRIKTKPKKATPYKNFLEKAMRGKYEIFKKVKGAFKDIGTEHSLFEASKKLKKGLKKDLSASGFIINERTGKKVKAQKIIGASVIASGQWRVGKRNEFLMVQKKSGASSRLGTRNEIWEIQQTKKKKNDFSEMKKKQKKNNFFGFEKLLKKPTAKLPSYSPNKFIASFTRKRKIGWR